MKRSAFQHTKMRRLMRILDVPLYAAVGILEAVWNLTAREAPQGNLGKLRDEDIADALGWSGEAANLIAALVSSGWMDVSEEHRLIVHDWHEHADDAVKKSLQRSTLPFLSRNVGTSRDISRLPEPEPEPEPEDSHPAEPDPSVEERFAEEQVVQRAFALYCRELRRDPSRYTLTPERKKKALLRIRERKRIRGDIAGVEAEIATCIRNLSASEYHVTNSYIDWTDQIFRSAEEFEKRLNWKMATTAKPKTIYATVEAQ